MGYPIGQELDFVYEYDFSVSGGAISTIPLVNKRANALAAGLVILDWTINVEAALTGGATTITLGNAGNTSGYSADFFAAATLGAVINRGDRAGALVWDDTNDHAIYYKIDTAANAVPSVTIGGAAVTAGKFKVYIKAMRLA